MENGKITLAFFCPVCKNSVAVERTAFQLKASPNHIPCPCGKSELYIDIDGDKAHLSVPCIFCGKNHEITCAADAFSHRDTLSFSCRATALDCLYIGKEEFVFPALRRLEHSVDAYFAAKQNESEGKEKPFLNEIIMAETLEELKEIGGQGGIKCVCGSDEYSIQVTYSAVDLICKKCDRVLRIPAATVEDLSDLCCSLNLTIGNYGRYGNE